MRKKELHGDSRPAHVAAAGDSKEDVGTDGCVADDLHVAFGLDGCALTGSSRQQVVEWVNGWMTRYPGAVVVMGCNGKSRNSERSTRDARLQALCEILVTCGVSETRVRYTDDIVEVDSERSGIAPDRGVVCLKSLRSTVLDSMVMPISELFRRT